MRRVSLLWEIKKERYQEGREAGLVEGCTEVVPFLIEMSIKMIGDEEKSINEVTNTVPSLNVEQVHIKILFVGFMENFCKTYFLCK